MAINLEALQKKLNQLSGQNTRKTISWRPPENGEEVTVRLISFPNNDGQPFKERWFYYGVGNNQSLLTPHQFGKPDPIQELIDKLRADKSENAKDSYELAKKLYPKMRSYAAVVVRGEEDKGVRLWAFGKTVYQDLLKLLLDTDYGDITDIDEGYDLKVTCAKLPGKKYAETSVRARNKSSVLTNDKSQLKKWLDSIPDLDEMYTLKSYGELEKIVNDWLENPNANDETPRGQEAVETDTETVETPKVSQKSSPVKESAAPAVKSKKAEKVAPTTSTLADLDNAFADLEDF